MIVFVHELLLLPTHYTINTVLKGWTRFLSFAVRYTECCFISACFRFSYYRGTAIKGARLTNAIIIPAGNMTTD